VDRLGSVLRVLVTARSALPLRERVVAALLGQLGQEFGGEASVVEVLHLPRRPAGELTCARLVGGPVPPAPLVVTEAGLQFRVEPGLTESSRPRPGTGLFLDQRENRMRLRARVVAGGRYLNLFAHTGAFSAALLAGGAGQVVSVDLSAPYLAWLEENLERSELPRDRHVSVRADARRFLAEASDRPFDGIVLDPPTAAAAGRNFFSVRAELVELLAACLERLAPGGWLFVSRNDRRGRGQLAERMEEAAERGGAGLSFLEPAPPGADFPSLRGFPEGDPFEAVITGRA
jgi:23S rRNA G2069 N7-methylase RlmK/C1962 C5-methylase RlmI